MKIFIVSAFLMGIVAMSAKSTEYAPNDGKSSPGTFNSKSTSAAADIMGTTDASPAVPSTQIDPSKINTSPNPAPEKGIDNSSYGEAISTDKPYRGMKQAEEERPKTKSKK